MKASALLEEFKMELAYLRELGAEFSREHPEVASNIGVGEPGHSDPYVEQLVESVAFLTARVQHKIDAGYPKLSSQLIELMFPIVGQPFPSHAVLEVKPERLVRGETDTSTIRAGTQLQSEAISSIPRCQYSLLTDCSINNSVVDQVQVFENDIPWPSGIPSLERKTACSAIKICISSLGDTELSFNENLRLYLSGSHSEVSLFLQQFWRQETCIYVNDGEKLRTIPFARCKPLGYYWPVDELSTDSYTEHLSYLYSIYYFYFADIYHFIELDTSEIDLTAARSIDLWLFSDVNLMQNQKVYTNKFFKTNCMPVVNRITKRFDRLNLKQGISSYPIVVDRMNPLHFEVLSVSKVMGYGFGNELLSDFSPISTQKTSNGSNYQVELQPVISNNEHAVGSTQAVLNLSPNSLLQRKIKQVAIEGLCSNRRWPEMLRKNNLRPRWLMDSELSFSDINLVSGPSNVFYPPVGERAFWSLVQNVANQINYLLSSDPQRSAERLRRYLSIFISEGNLRHKQLCSSIYSIHHRQVLKRVKTLGIPCIVCGLDIKLELKDQTYPHGETYLFGAFIERLFACLVSTNSFVQFSLYSERHGDVCRWPVRTGLAQQL